MRRKIYFLSALCFSMMSNAQENNNVEKHSTTPVIQEKMFWRKECALKKEIRGGKTK